MWGKGEKIVPTEVWEARVMQDAVFMSEYGCPFDARTTLPAREYQAHIAILRGKAARIEEEDRKMKRRLLRRR
ncbi:hypothetical protein DSECCO2_213370 [anaerobic digester metagenome]